MPTISGLRRRGYTPESIRRFAELIGVAKTNSTVDIGKLEYCIRDDLNHKAPRVMCVLRPLKIILTNYPEAQTEWLDASYFPHDVPREGSRKIPFSKEIYIERTDFMEHPSARFHRMAPGREVRLRYGYLITCDEVVKNDDGEIIALQCHYDHETRGGNAPDGRKVKGTIHWVAAEASVPAEVRLYDRLFTSAQPDSAGGEGHFTDFLNPDSLTVLSEARVEPSVVEDDDDLRYQFERQGYFWRDRVLSTDAKPVFNRIVSLRDSWAKITGTANTTTMRPEKKTARASANTRPEKKPKAYIREKLRSDNPALMAKYTYYINALKISEEDAALLSENETRADFFEAALTTGPTTAEVSKWVVNELMSSVKRSGTDTLPFSGEKFGELVSLVHKGTISSTAGKKVLEEMLSTGGDPHGIVKAQGLTQVNDETAIQSAIDDVLEKHPEEVARFRAGEGRLMGFLIGQVMKASKGQANPSLARDLLQKSLSE